MVYLIELDNTVLADNRSVVDLVQKALCNKNTYQ